jgi:hypothetical protein
MLNFQSGLFSFLFFSFLFKVEWQGTEYIFHIGQVSALYKCGKRVNIFIWQLPYEKGSELAAPFTK